MTAIDDFCAALTACKDHFTWQIDYPSRIRTLTGPETSSHGFCPLTAVVFSTQGQKLSLGRVRSAAHLLGLNGPDAHRIITAADSRSSGSRAIATLRARLLACLGLEEIP